MGSNQMKTDIDLAFAAPGGRNNRRGGGRLLQIGLAPKKEADSELDRHDAST
jgi:hypothetical protein